MKRVEKLRSPFMQTVAKYKDDPTAPPGMDEFAQSVLDRNELLRPAGSALSRKALKEALDKRELPALSS